jgi:hypothetical protein
MSFACTFHLGEKDCRNGLFTACVYVPVKRRQKTASPPRPHNANDPPYHSAKNQTKPPAPSSCSSCVSFGNRAQGHGQTAEGVATSIISQGPYSAGVKRRPDGEEGELAYVRWQRQTNLACLTLCREVGAKGGRSL